MKNIEMKIMLKDSEGFTLIEVIMAVVIFSIGILAIVGVQHRIVAGNANGNIVTQELMLAQRVVEQLKNNPTPGNLNSSTQNGVDVYGNNGGPYNVTTLIMPAISGSSSRFISVTVSKTGPGGHPVTIQSLTHGYGT